MSTRSRPRGGADSSGMGRVRRALDALRERLWFWPAACAVLAVVAAESLVRLDRALDQNNARPIWVFSGNADAARSVLSTIASATMTVLGVTLSITLAVFALTAQGYSPRALRRFMRDRVIQAVIAGFVGTFVFALVALRLVRIEQVPGITVNVAVALGFATLTLLVVFFHHMAAEISVERLIDAIWEETVDVIPFATGAHRGEDRDVDPEALPVTEVRTAHTGRVRWIDDARLAAIARDSGGTAVVAPAPGDFVADGEWVVRFHGGEPLDDDQMDDARAAVEIGTQRTMTQDVAFGLRQLSDVGLRALSPGINDPTTAEEAIMRAADVLRRLADRQLGVVVLDDDDRLLVVRARPTWEALVGLAFDQYLGEAEGQADTATMLVLLDALGRVISGTNDPGRLAALRARAVRIRDGARRALPDPSDLARVEEAAARIA